MVAPADMPRRTLKAIWFGSLLILLSTTHSAAQTNSPQAVSVLTQALSASGTVNSINPIRNFTATGTITFFRSRKPVQAPATIRAQGNKQLRLDATLPEGPWTMALSGDAGARKDERGNLTRIPLHNTISMGGSPFPYLSIAAALADSTVTASDLGLVPASGWRQLRRIRIIRTPPAADDPNGIVKKLSQTDYFVDSQTNLVVKIQDFTHPIETLTTDYLREMELESYTTFNGVAVPTLVRQKIAGQKIWEFNLKSITFNTPLTDADFTVQ